MRPVRAAAIIAVGSELLTPDRTDTNSLWLTARLNELGIDVRMKIVAGDSTDDLSAAFTLALAHADLVVTTGGLGPTADDLTRETVAAVLGRDLEPNGSVLEAIRERFRRRGLPMPAVNARQASVPAGAVVLPNHAGTAPGLWLEAGDRVCVLLPGPPRELQPMFEAHVAPRLQERVGVQRLRRRVIGVTGLTESRTEEIAQPVYSTFATEAIPLATTILASPGRIELHLSAAGSDATALDGALDQGVQRLAAALGDAVFSTDGRTLEQVVAAILEARKLRLAVAESCTGGLVLGRLTNVPGSSGWLIGGVVAYDNAVKIEALGVPPALIEEQGAVSEEVARAMAEGVRRRFGADIGLSVTGVAGPSGGTPAKPVGTVAIALDGPSPRARTFAFGGDRAMVRALSVAAALDMVRRSLG